MKQCEDKWGFKEGDPITDELTAIRLLGGGSSYEAYLAFDDVTYAPTVVKVVRPHRVDDESSLRGLRREVDTLSKVNHPVVARGLRAVLEGERPHVVLEAIDGPRLSTLIRRHGPLQEQQYLPLAIEIASALHYFRRQGIVHLDIKPSNIIMGAPARLIDLSVARKTEAAAALTYPIGTDAYMAPEQCDPPASGTPDHASDIWGLGATLFESIAGYRPFDDGVEDAPDAVDRFPQLKDLAYSLPDQLAADVAKVVMAALEPDPRHRPLPHELAEGLEPALARAPKGRLAGWKVR
ncbi:MAG: serine/threonine protein kinase [Nocardioidaceae bacterium]|nr:serine/threonine protein kinase [Nocardioidaceae bacterium]